MNRVVGYIPCLFDYKNPYRTPAGRVDVGQPLKDIRATVKAIPDLTIQEIEQVLQEERAGRARSSVLGYLQAQQRKITRVAGRRKDRHVNPSADRHVNPFADRHVNPSADRHKRAVDPNRGDSLRDFF